MRDTHLYRHKKNGKLYKLYLHVRSMYTGDVYTAEPYMHDTPAKKVPKRRPRHGDGFVNPKDFEKAYRRNDL